MMMMLYVLDFEGTRKGWVDLFALSFGFSYQGWLVDRSCLESGTLCWLFSVDWREIT
jgi:hypothetical protein